MNNLKTHILYLFFLLSISLNLKAMRRNTGLNVSQSGILPICITTNVATTADIDQLLDLMDVIEADEEDSQLLVIIPRAQRQISLMNAINKKQIYVSKTLNGTIISFLKLYLIDRTIKLDKSLNQYVSELSTVLIEELRCCKGTPGDLIPLQSNKCHYHGVRAVEPKFNECNDANCCFINDSFEPHEQQTFIYYGGAYTCKDYRGKGYGSDLLNYAFSSIIEKIVYDVRMNNSQEFILAYGQAAANKDRKLMLRQFVSMISSLHSSLQLPRTSCYDIFHETFDAYVPKFDEDGYLLPDSDDRKGFGNLVIYRSSQCFTQS